MPGADVAVTLGVPRGAVGCLQCEDEAPTLRDEFRISAYVNGLTYVPHFIVNKYIISKVVVD